MTNTQKISSKPATSMAELLANNSGAFQVLKKGDIIEGTVKKLTPQEILLSIGGKSDALVIEYDKQNLENLLSLLKVGDKVSASVISPESEEGFPVVSLRRMLETRVYSGLEDLYKDNKTFKIEIVDGTRGGYFVQTTDGIRGFLPNSQLQDSHAQNGARLDVKIIEFDKEKKRVIFSQKATYYTMNPQEIAKHVKKGDTIDAVVKVVTPYGVYLEIKPSEGVIIEGFIHISEVSHQRVETLQEKYKEGEVLKVFVLDVDNENKRVNLSLKHLEKDTFSEVKKKYEAGQTVTGTVKDIKSRGVTLELGANINAFVPSNKVPTDTTYEIGGKVELEIVDFDDKKRLINATPVLKTKFIGYR